MPPEKERYLAHYGVPGQKWGRRQWQNADGTYTEAGKHHYGWGYGRRVQRNQQLQPGTRTEGRTINRLSSGTRTEGRRPNRTPLGTRNVQNQRSRRPSQAEIEARKARARRILGLAAGMAVSVGAMYGLHRYNKANQNLIQIAKNRVNDTYNESAKYLTGEALRRNREWRARDIAAVTDRYSARKVLGLKTGKRTRQFIKNNSLAKLNTADLVEQRVGTLVEGYRRTAFGNLKKLTGLRLRRERDRMARRFYE